jgi:hypothetical protein
MSNSLDLVPTVVLLHLNTVRHVKCVRKMRWQDMWHAWGEKRCRLGVVQNFRYRDHTDKQGIEGITILKWILSK